VFSPKIIFIIGPTAVGKTDIALNIASQIPSEIVSCDSMQVYREISIASSKPSLAQRNKVPHHVLDVISIAEKFDVAAFNIMATSAIESILAKKKYPLVVGGSGMYVQILLDGIFEGGEQDPVLRKKLESMGAEALYKKLKKVDPDAAEKIHSNDVRRLVRALEVYETTNEPISQLQKQRSGLWGKYEIIIIGLNREREELYEMINQRAEGMFGEGLIKEVKAISDSKMSLTAQRIIGVGEVLAYLRGESTLEEAKELMKMNTRRLAKRQLTWFRKDKRITWLMSRAGDSAQEVSKKILKEIN